MQREQAESRDFLDNQRLPASSPWASVGINRCMQHWQHPYKHLCDVLTLDALDAWPISILQLQCGPFGQFILARIDSSSLWAVR